MDVDTSLKLANVIQLAISIVSAQAAEGKKKTLANHRNLELGEILKTHFILHINKLRNREVNKFVPRPPIAEFGDKSSPKERSSDQLKSTFVTPVMLQCQQEPNRQRNIS